VFGKQLKVVRAAKGLSQAALAALIAPDDVAEEKRWLRNIKNWEQNVGEPRWSDVLAIADALGVSCEAFREPAPRA
jgi:transcriptional regulator with XRE-family HTH domain